MTTKSSMAQTDENSILHKMRHSRTLIRECWHCAIYRTDTHTVIDATAGRGSDTITLGKLVGQKGTVHAMDIQPDAVKETRTRYDEVARTAIESNGAEEAMGILHLHCASHENLALLGLAPKSVACIVYNLGWYPGHGADRTIVTVARSTVASLKSAEELVAVDGVITVTVYVGHDGGKEEEEAVLAWARRLNKKEWNVINVSYPNRGTAPRMIICERLS